MEDTYILDRMKIQIEEFEKNGDFEQSSMIKDLINSMSNGKEMTDVCAVKTGATVTIDKFDGEGTEGKEPVETAIFNNGEK